MSRSYKHIRRDNARAFPHQVRLPRARLWRMDHVDAQLRHLQPRQWAWWHEGDELRSDDVGVWGFKCPVQAVALRDWSMRCGIDWSIPPEQQIDRPPLRANRHDGLILPPLRAPLPRGLACVTMYAGPHRCRLAFFLDVVAAIGTAKRDGLAVPRLTGNRPTADKTP
jgi:hypothetical protein